jgi:FSR family fosmidomycin resistance protein-like MFS transporter
MTTATLVGETTEKRSFVEVWLITIGHSLTHWYPATFYILAPLIGSELGLSYTEIASIMTVQALAGALANIPGGIVSDTVSRKGLMMALSLAWVGLPYMMMAMTHAYWMLLACAILIGIGNTIWHPTAIPTLAKRYPERKGLVVSIHGMGGNVGDAVAPFLAGLLLSGVAIGSLITLPAITWREVMIYNVIPGMAMAVAILWYLGKLQMDGSAKTGDEALGLGQAARGMGSLFKNNTLMMLATSSAFRSMTQGSLMIFVPLYLANTMNYSPWAVGAAMMAIQICGFIASPIAGAMSDKMGRRNIMMSSMIMTAVVLLFMIFAGGTPLFVIFVALLGFFLFAVRSVLQAWTLDATPKNLGGSAIGLLFGIQAIGGAVGPFISGLVADHYGLLAAFYFMAFTIIVANMFVFFVPEIGDKAKA